LCSITVKIAVSFSEEAKQIIPSVRGKPLQNKLEPFAAFISTSRNKKKGGFSHFFPEHPRTVLMRTDQSFLLASLEA
jgi:hypothetical protein